MDNPGQNEMVKKSFFEHLRRQGYTEEHIEVYHEYFDFFISKLGAAKIMNLDPESIYRVALLGVEDLEGDDVIEAFLQMMESFVEFWAERWEAMQPE